MELVGTGSFPNFVVYILLDVTSGVKRVGVDPAPHERDAPPDEAQTPECVFAGHGGNGGGRQLCYNGYQAFGLSGWRSGAPGGDIATWRGGPPPGDIATFETAGQKSSLSKP